MRDGPTIMALIEGDSLFIRLRIYRRAHQKYYSAEQRLGMYLEEADSNGGRLLWVGKVWPYNHEHFAQKGIVNLILVNPATLHAIVGHIVSTGDHYDPRRNSPALGFNPVPPLSQMPNATWIALEQVEDIPRFDIDDYETVVPAASCTPAMPLPEAIDRSGQYVKALWIRPREQA